MIDYDLHIHTNLVKHSDPRQSVDEIIARADERGLKTITITEHLSKPDHLHRIETIRRQVDACQSNCRVLVGAEVDVDRNFTDGRLVINDRDLMDVMIGSMHYFPGTKILPHLQEMPDMDADYIFQQWRDTFLGMAANQLIDIIAHPGALIANALDKTRFAPEVLDVFQQAAELSAKSGIAWEINNSIAKKLSDAQRQQYWQILKIAMDANVVLTCGSDAHRPEDVGEQDFIAKIVEKLGGWHIVENPKLPRVTIYATL